MGVAFAEAVDDDVVVVTAFGVDVFVIVEGHADVGDGFLAEENQVALAQVCAFELG